jgi:hypothetical protein
MSFLIDKEDTTMGASFRVVRRTISDISNTDRRFGTIGEIFSFIGKAKMQWGAHRRWIRHPKQVHGDGEGCLGTFRNPVAAWGKDVMASQESLTAEHVP